MLVFLVAVLLSWSLVRLSCAVILLSSHFDGCMHLLSKQCVVRPWRLYARHAAERLSCYCGWQPGQRAGAHRRRGRSRTGRTGYIVTTNLAARQIIDRTPYDQTAPYLTLPYLRGGQALTPAQRWGRYQLGPMRVPECNHNVTGSGYEAPTLRQGGWPRWGTKQRMAWQNRFRVYVMACLCRRLPNFDISLFIFSLVVNNCQSCCF